MNRERLYFFDIGNTRIKAGTFADGGWELLFGVATRPLDSLSGRLRESLAGLKDRSQGAGTTWAGSSVCPEAMRRLRKVLRELGASRILQFGEDVGVPIATLVEEFDRVGRDRLLCALGARERVGAPCGVVSAGTAITVDLVDAEGRFAGGAIGPGFGLCARALHGETALLPEVSPRVPAHPVGRNTTEALESGIYHFCRGGVEALVREFSREMGRDMPVAMTGGDSELLSSLCETFEVHRAPQLIFEGMRAALDAAPQGG